MFNPSYSSRSENGITLFFIKNILHSICGNSNMTAPQAVGFCFTRLGNLLGVNKMACTPVTLDKSPSTSHVDRIPRVSESVILKLDPRLVPGGLAVTLDHDAVEPGVAEIFFVVLFEIFSRRKIFLMRRRSDIFRVILSSKSCRIKVCCFKFLHLVD